MSTDLVSTEPMTGSSTVQIVEVGPRDGLQNEHKILPVHVRIELVEALARTGLRRIEAGSFVSPKQVPQMAESAEVFRRLRQDPGVTYSALVANKKGLEAAMSAGVREIAVFAGASESFSQKNVNCSVADSLVRYRDVTTEALRHGIRIRGYVSCVLGCPYEGHVPPASVLTVARSLFEMGCFEVSLGDTIGSGTPETTTELLHALIGPLSPERLAVHFHDTAGRAIENIGVALGMGVRVIDSSIGGLGGCPFAPGSPGNVATEHVVSAMHARGFATGIDGRALAVVAKWVADMLGKHRVCPAQATGE